MKALVGFASGWIAFYAADQFLFGGQMTGALPSLAKSILNGFGIYF
jgi:hypothetical protein